MTGIIFDEHEDWEKRILCSDEACIGIIGPDGKCKECGKTYEGVLPAADCANNKSVLATDEQKTAMQTNIDPDDDDWDKRVLCSDESCIGTIGPDGLCKECGKPLK